MKWFDRSLGPARVLAVGLSLAALLVAGCGDAKKKSSGSGGTRKNASAEKLLDAAQDALLAGQKEKAVQTYTEAIKIDPDCSKAYEGRAMVRSELGDKDGALKDYTKAIEIDPGRSSYAYEQRAAIYRKRGEKNRANADTKMAEDIRNRERDKLPEKRRRFEEKRKK